MPRPAGQLVCSARGEQELGRHYDRMLAELPFPAQQLDVSTPTFGRTRVTVAGPPDAPPLMLWQGAGAPGPYMLYMCAPLARHYRVYAPDTPGKGGRSEAMELDPATHEWGAWCAELVSALGLLTEGAPPPLHVGVSMGGCTFLDLAHVAPHAVRCAALIVPGSLHPEWGTYRHALRLALWCSLPMALYCLLPCRWTARLGLWALMDEPDPDDPLTQQLLLMFRYACDMSGETLPRRFEAEQLAGLHSPVLVLASEKDIFGGGADMAARARQVLPNCTAEVVPGARHCASLARMEAALQRVVEFFREHCG